MLVGITGPSGAGKGAVVVAFEARGFGIVDADKVAREIVMPGEPALAELAVSFGGDLINSDGTLNRRMLADRAFSSRESTDRLNQIMHGSICRRMLERAEELGARGINCVFDAPLLFEAGLEKYCDCVISVIAPVGIRAQRLAKRDGLTSEQISRRMQAQHDDEYYTSRSQYIIVNDGSLQQLAEKSEEVVKDIIARYDSKGGLTD